MPSTAQNAAAAGTWQRSAAAKAVVRELLNDETLAKDSEGFQKELDSPYFGLIAADHHDSCDTVISPSSLPSVIFFNLRMHPGLCIPEGA